MRDQRNKTSAPGIFYRERPLAPGSSRTVRVYCLIDRSGDKPRWTQKDSKGNDLLSLDAAKERKEELRKAKKSGASPVVPSKVTLAEYVDSWLALQTELAPRTRESYGEQLERFKPLIGSLRVSALNEEKLSEAIARLRKPDGSKYAPNTIVHSLTPLSCLLDDAVADRILSFNPLATLKLKQKGKRRKGNLIPRARNVKENRILTQKEIDSLLAAASSDRYRMLLSTAIYTGLRQMELLGLTWGDVDFDERIIRVRYQLSRTAGEGRVPYTKSEAGQREVPLSDELLQALREYRMSRPVFKTDTDYIFPTSTGKPLGWSNVDRMLASAVTAAKLREPAPKWHDLRHTYVSILEAGGCNVREVSTMIGHSDPGFTLRVYGDLFDREGSAERVRVATAQGNNVVMPASSQSPLAPTGQLVPFPGNVPLSGDNVADAH